jgi:hypothetical protein
MREGVTLSMMKMSTSQKRRFTECIPADSPVRTPGKKKPALQNDHDYAHARPSKAMSLARGCLFEPSPSLDVTSKEQARQHLLHELNANMISLCCVSENGSILYREPNQLSHDKVFEEKILSKIKFSNELCYNIALTSHQRTKF